MNQHLIIDDGSHTSSNIVKSFALYFDALSEGGLYIAEDLHCSYWNDYQGGLYNPLSSIHFFKLLCDIVNHQSWGLPMTRRELLEEFSKHYGSELPEDLLAQVHSVEFINSICVVRKAAAPSNTLGRRMVRGHDALVNKDPLDVDGQELMSPLQCLPDIASQTKSAPLFFDEDFYLSSYPDVAAAGVNALDHYLGNGKSEGRHPTAERAVLAALQEAKVWGREQIAVLAGLPAVVAEHGSVLAETIKAAQQHQELWHLQHAARFDQLTKQNADDEEQEPLRQEALKLALAEIKAVLYAELRELVLAQGLTLADTIEACEGKLSNGQAAFAEKIVSLLEVQAMTAEERIQRWQDGLHKEVSLLKTEFSQTNAAYWETKQTYEARLAALSYELEVERKRRLWQASHPFKSFWRSLFSCKSRVLAAGGDSRSK